MNTITAARASEQAKLDVKTMIRDSTCMPDRDYYVKRTLFSGDILGIENFKRFRLFEKDNIGQEMENFVQKLTFAKDDPTVSTTLIPDVMKLIYLATTKSEVSLIVDLLHKCYGQRDTDEEVADGGNKIVPGQSHSRHFQLGPLFMRLLHILKNTETALAVWQDQKLKNVFSKTTCCLVLMDLLYNEGQYQAVIKTFCQMQEAKVSPVQYPPDCTTLALAALYQMNSKEALVEAKQYIEQSRKERSLLSRRSMLFAAGLALNQGDPVYALDIANHLCNDSNKESIFRNVKVIAFAQLGQMKDALDLMEGGLWVDVPTQSRVGTIFSNTVNLFCVYYWNMDTLKTSVW
ncbi:hypothetical protein C0Q70_00392 [Pomacea canaliculata]|uniref:Uncharacterized protein n=1 Tax=Pomacea canaliculata TaxID=400727 RepID=A0A2T7PWI9_POMCA|nr:hypothetical protein C0Q70_00392 [Pomacea canaliculata]